MGSGSRPDLYFFYALTSILNSGVKLLHLDKKMIRHLVLTRPLTFYCFMRALYTQKFFEDRNL